MKTVAAMAGLFVLAACAGDTGSIGSVAISPGGFSAASGDLSITSDGFVMIAHDDLVDVGIARPGLYDEARALVLAEGPAVAAGLDPAAPPCPGYAATEIRLTPPEAGIGTLSSVCPDEALTDLVERVRALAVGL